jgi:hypothetical protein
MSRLIELIFERGFMKKSFIVTFVMFIGAFSNAADMEVVKNGIICADSASELTEKVNGIERESFSKIVHNDYILVTYLDKTKVVVKLPVKVSQPTSAELGNKDYTVKRICATVVSEAKATR